MDGYFVCVFPIFDHSELAFTLLISSLSVKDKKIWQLSCVLDRSMRQRWCFVPEKTDAMSLASHRTGVQNDQESGRKYWNTHSFAHSLVHSFTRTAHLFAWSTLLISLACSFFCSLTHSLTPKLAGRRCLKSTWFCATVESSHPAIQSIWTSRTRFSHPAVKSMCTSKNPSFLPAIWWSKILALGIYWDIWSLWFLTHIHWEKNEFIDLKTFRLLRLPYSP